MIDRIDRTNAERQRRWRARRQLEHEQNAALKRYLMTRLYSQPAIAEDRERSVAQLDELFRLYLASPDRMPPFYAELAAREPRHRVVCDYIAGMTDHFLLRLCRELVPTPAARTA